MDGLVIEGIALGPDEIRACVDRLAGEIGLRLLKMERPLAVVVLEGARRFASDLLARFDSPPERAFVTARSWRGGMSSTGRVDISGYNGPPCSGRDLILIDDIYDTGLTLSELVKRLKADGARSVTTCTLIEKPGAHRVNMAVDHVGAAIENRFVVGYGLDHRGRYRELPYIAYAAEV